MTCTIKRKCIYNTISCCPQLKTSSGGCCAGLAFHVGDIAACLTDLGVFWIPGAANTAVPVVGLGFVDHIFFLLTFNPSAHLLLHLADGPLPSLALLLSLLWLLFLLLCLHRFLVLVGRERLW